MSNSNGENQLIPIVEHRPVGIKYQKGQGW